MSKLDKTSNLMNINKATVFGSGLNNEKAAESLVTDIVQHKKKPQESDMQRLSFLMSKSLAHELKGHAGRTGKTIQSIINNCLRDFFRDTDAIVLENGYAGDTSVQRGVNIHSDLMQQLEHFTDRKGVTKRFVVEALLTIYLKSI